MILKKEKTKGIEIDLTGPQGNAYYLIGTAKRFGKQLDMSKSYIDDMVKRMMCGDYENLVKVFEEEFGSVVTLYR